RAVRPHLHRGGDLLRHEQQEDPGSHPPVAGRREVRPRGPVVHAPALRQQAVPPALLRRHRAGPRRLRHRPGQPPRLEQVAVVLAAVARASFPSWHTHTDVLALVAVLEGAYLWTVRRRGALTGEPTDRRKAWLFTAGVFTLWVAS